MPLFLKDPLQIITFQSYGRGNRLYLRGRALEDENINLEGKGFLKLFLNSFKRFNTDKISNTELTIRLNDGRVLETKTDSKGYFKISESIENLQSLIDDEGWMSYEISYKHAIEGRKIQQENCFVGKMLIPAATASYGVISDIDDTILHTGVASRLKWRTQKHLF